MLDRKTKDIDADVELLEDRLKGDNIQFVFTALFGTVFMTVGLICWVKEEWFFMDFCLLMAIIMYVISVWSLITISQRNMLLFFKKHMKVKTV
jgi:hypothetical protein